MHACVALSDQLPTCPRSECQHIIHSLNERGVKKWVALSEGQAGTIGWLTTNERKEAMWYVALTYMHDAIAI